MKTADLGIKVVIGYGIQIPSNGTTMISGFETTPLECGIFWGHIMGVPVFPQALGRRLFKRFSPFRFLHIKLERSEWEPFPVDVNSIGDPLGPISLGNKLTIIGMTVSVL